MPGQAKINETLPSSEDWVKTLAPDGRLAYRAEWLAATEADQFLTELDQQIGWQQRHIRLFGRRVMQPRLIAFHADPGVTYSYSGDRLQGSGWPPLLAALIERLWRDVGMRFNSVLCNQYRDGNDAMGWHADDEPELGQSPIIASLSLGALRRLRFKPRDGGSRRVVLMPASGSLLVMSGQLQRYWLHEVPRMRRIAEPRVNLTFRQILR